MKRFLGILFLSLVISTSAQAVTTIPWTKEGCESVKGTWITSHAATDSGCDAAHCNNRNFCRSNVQMSWFSALIWCQSIGRTLTDVETACPNSLSNNTCANLKENLSQNWTSTPCGQQSAYLLESRNILWCDDTWVKRDGSVYRGYALCK